MNAASVRLLGENSSQGNGELQLLDDSTWTQMCSGALDPIEAQLACRELGFSFVVRTGIVDELAIKVSTFTKRANSQCSVLQANGYG